MMRHHDDGEIVSDDGKATYLDHQPSCQQQSPRNTLSRCVSAIVVVLARQNERTICSNEEEADRHASCCTSVSVEITTPILKSYVCWEPIDSFGVVHR